jgi:hypothetical protein
VTELWWPERGRRPRCPAFSFFRTSFTTTGSALADGIITRGKAELIVRLTQYLDDDEARAVEAAILGGRGG